MSQTIETAYTKRQSQWNAFNRWESDRPAPQLSEEERITWYSSAFTFYRSLSDISDPNRFREKAALLGSIRQRLSGLKHPASDG